MTYTKPEVVALAYACAAIQSSDGDKTGGMFESIQHPTETPAYEADE